MGTCWVILCLWDVASGFELWHEGWGLWYDKCGLGGEHSGESVLRPD